MAFKAAVSRAVWSTSLLAARHRKTAGLSQCSLCGTEKRPLYFYPGSQAAVVAAGSRQFSSTSHRCVRGRNPSFRSVKLHRYWHWRQCIYFMMMKVWKPYVGTRFSRVALSFSSFSRVALSLFSLFLCRAIVIRPFPVSHYRYSHYSVRNSAFRIIADNTWPPTPLLLFFFQTILGLKPILSLPEASALRKSAAYLGIPKNG